MLGQRGRLDGVIMRTVDVILAFPQLVLALLLVLLAAAAFARPVLLVHGDSHYFRIDKPLLDAAGNRIESFTRLRTR